jgi:molecular chaperone DnaJ
VGVPVFDACPECGGTGQVFPFRCMECGGSGLVEEQRTLRVRVPSRVQPRTVLEVSLEMFGISNLYLRVQVSISDAL